ncbi:hypothetical protein F4803DRAFT_420774 [Xylaria telfairii]|nr:hypothetical protein F4803DRAFT_420774 [Xylaria telfairii]
MPIDDSDFSSASMQNDIYCQNDPESSNRYSDVVWLEEIGFSRFTFEDAVVMNNSGLMAGQGTAPGLLFRPMNLTPIGKHRHENGYAVHKFAGEYDSISPHVFNFNYTCSTHAVGWVHDNTYNPSPYSPAAISGARPRRPLLRYSLPMQQPSAMEPSRQHACSMCAEAFMHRKDLLRHKNTIHATGDEETYRCRCSKTGFRKDNYLRHVGSCNRKYQYPNYTCKCHAACERRDEHIVHVKQCQYGFGQTGRPRVLCAGA